MGASRAAHCARRAPKTHGAQVLDKVLEQLVGAEALARLGVLDHQVLKAVHVAAGLEHGVGRERRALDLQHAVLEHKVLPPQLQQVLLQRAARGAVVEQPRHAAVDLKRRHHEHAPRERVLERLFVHLPLAAVVLGARRRELRVERLAQALELLHRRLHRRRRRALGLERAHQRGLLGHARLEAVEVLEAVVVSQVVYVVGCVGVGGRRREFIRSILARAIHTAAPPRRPLHSAPAPPRAPALPSRCRHGFLRRRAARGRPLGHGDAF